MPKKTVYDLPTVHGQRVLVRVDFNVPLTPTGAIANDRRIRKTLPTIQYLVEKGACSIVMSHLGRPTGDPQADAIYRMDRVAHRLEELLGRPVRKADEVVGPAVERAVAALAPGDVLVLENLRFHPGEKAGDAAFARSLANLGTIYVNDAFGTCHNTDASMVAVPRAMQDRPRVAGLLLARELEVLTHLLENPQRPLVGIVGGAKVSDKIAFLRSLLGRVDRLLVGGAMTYTFMKAQGRSIGSSRCENERLDLARELLAQAGDRLLLPEDHVVADRPSADAHTRVVAGEIPEGWYGMDIGPQTRERYAAWIRRAGTVVWNGPMGKFEDAPFAQGTRAVAHALADSQAVTIVGGGETAEAVESFGLDSRIAHVSTGGGAFLEFLSGSRLPGLEYLEERT
ncbi:MAG: phosphoglycerate kinase [Gemmataceae bacterium]